MGREVRHLTVKINGDKGALTTLDNGVVVAEARARMQNLGPQAMLADATPEWMGVARGAAAIPGSRNTVVKPLLDRDAGKNARMQGVVDSELGPAPTPSWQEARIKNNQQDLGPVYDRVMEGQPPIDVNIGLLQKVDDELLHAKGDRAAALNKVRQALLMQNGQPDISARGVLESRRALDIAAENTTSGNEKRILGGYRQPIAQALDERSPRLAKVDPLPLPPLSIFNTQLQGSGDRGQSTTMGFVRILTSLLKDPELGKLVIPIVPDESRTFGMEGLFRQIGIHSYLGQLYTPQDAGQLSYYKEAKDGQILQEGIN